VQRRGDEEAQQYDADYVRALEYGMPPAGGVGSEWTGSSWCSPISLDPGRDPVPGDGARRRDTGGQADRRAGGQPDELAVAGAAGYLSFYGGPQPSSGGSRVATPLAPDQAGCLAQHYHRDGGVAVGVLALIVVLGVMNGCATIFRERILGGRAPSPGTDLRGRPAARRLASVLGR